MKMWIRGWRRELRTVNPESKTQNPKLLLALSLALLVAAPAAASAGVGITALGSWGGTVWDVAADGNIIAMTSGGRVLIVDISNPAAPVEVSSLDFRNEATCVQVHGNYLYVGGEPHSVCFRVYDISNPAAPVQVYVECGMTYYVLDMAWYGNDAYMMFDGAIWSWNMSDPRHPLKRNYVYGRAKGLAVSGDFLYVASDSATFRVYDLLANPFQPPLVAEIPLPSPSQWGGPIAISGNYAYVAPYGGNPGNYANVTVVDISDPLAPVVVGSIPDTRTDGVMEHTISTSNGILYVVPMDTPDYPYRPNATRLYDVASNPAAPVQVCTIPAIAHANGVRAVSTTAYVIDEGEGVIMFDCSNPAAPVRLGNVHSPAWMTKECKVGDLLYVADNWNGFTILDVSDPRHIPMNPVGVYQSTGDENWGIDVHDSLAYLGAGTGGLEIVDVSTPSAPVRVGHYPVPLGMKVDDLSIREGIAYVGASQEVGGCATYLLTFDVSNPANIVLLDSVLVQPGGGCRVSAVGVHTRAGRTVVYMANSQAASAESWTVDASDPANLSLLYDGPPYKPGDLVLSESGLLRFVVAETDGLSPAGLYIDDVSHPGAPSQLSYTPKGSHSVAVSGNRVYVSSPYTVLDVSNPAAPVVVAQGPNFRFGPDMDMVIEGPVVYGVCGSTAPGGVLIDLVATRGDFDDDGLVNAADVAAFVAVLLGNDTNPTHAIIADVNGDGRVDGRDIQAFVTLLLRP